MSDQLRFFNDFLFTRMHLITILLLFSAPVLSAPIVIGGFSAGDLKGWKEEEFSGNTQYRIISQDGIKVLSAESRATASGLFKEVDIDLEKTPFINWSWKIERVLDNVDERSKGGDDYAARIYVVSSGGFFFWNTKAVDYVWSSNQNKGTVWPNAYTPNASMVAVESGNANAGTWRTYKRNVLEDFKRLHGDSDVRINAIAVMTDTDNSKQNINAWYGDIFFSGE